MATTIRLDKGTPLTHAELDNNFKYPYKWSQNKTYQVGMLVSYNYNYYECITSHTSVTIFQPAKWKMYGGNNNSSGSGSSISYFWKSSTEQDLTIAQINELGVRLDEIGRPVYKFDGNGWVIVEDPNFVGTGNDYTLDGPANVVGYTNSAYPSIQTVKQALDRILYAEMAVNMGGGGTYEIGYTVPNVTIVWNVVGGDGVLSQVLSRTTPNPVVIANPNPNITQQILTGVNINVNTTYNLAATDSHGTKNGQTSLIFLPKLYWGAATLPGGYNSAFINGLSSNVLASSRSAIINAIPGANQYFWFALPTNYGTPVFTVGGFVGGFQLVTTLSHTNQQGYTQSYTIWRSDYPNLGNTTASIS